jgi:hypothetical protein
MYCMLLSWKQVDVPEAMRISGRIELELNLKVWVQFDQMESLGKGIPDKRKKDAWEKLHAAWEK